MSRPSWETYASDPIATIREVISEWSSDPAVSASPTAASWRSLPRCHRLRAALYQAATR